MTHVSDVSTSFKRLQAEKTEANFVLQECSPLKSFDDPSTLREYLGSISQKAEVRQRNRSSMSRS